jgi:hypothetical protein
MARSSWKLTSGLPDIVSLAGSLNKDASTSTGGVPAFREHSRSCAPASLMDAHPLAATGAPWHDRVTMETRRARAIAERLHLGDREEDGTPVIRHVQRVASTVTEEWTDVTERELLVAGLTSDELRALRLLNRTTDSRSDRSYLGHLELIARAAGSSGRLARIVKAADLNDRCLHPRVRHDGWSPPYARALQLLLEARDDPHRAGIAAVG